LRWLNGIGNGMMIVVDWQWEGGPSWGRGSYTAVRKGKGWEERRT
jgi:hypothetical protein